MKKRLAVMAAGLVWAGAYGAYTLYAEENGASPLGANTALDIISPVTAGLGGFTTGQGGAPSSAVNPAAMGDAQRIVFDIGYLAIVGLGDETGFGNAFSLGALFPTRYGVFGGSLRGLNSPFEESFPLGNTIGGNFSAAKELYPGMTVGLGFNFALGDDWAANADLGYRWNMGKMGPLQNFTWAVVLRSMGKGYSPSMFTPAGGLSFDFITVRGKAGKRDPLRMGFAADLAFPTAQNVSGKAGLNIAIAEIITLFPSTQFNLRETLDGNAPTPLPGLSLAVNIPLKASGGKTIAGTLPTDGEIAVQTAAKPLYNDVWAMGGGVTWHVGVRDTTPPVIKVDYPATAYFSPNNDGKADALEVPITISDQRYISEWVWEIRNEAGEVVRTYRNKERRPETQGWKNILSLLGDVKSQVEVPPALRWDGYLDAGTVAEDGTYTFTLSAADDNDNRSSAGPYTVVVDNTPPEVAITPLAAGLNIFSPDGDGNKDTLALTQQGSAEDLWDAGFYDSDGRKVRSFDVKDGSPAPFAWDGMTDDGEMALDGVYSFRVTSTDRALNTGSARLENIIISTIQPSVNVTIDNAWFSPNGDQVKDTETFTLTVPVKDGITGWELQVQAKDGGASTVKTFSDEGAPPAKIVFDGSGDNGRALVNGVTALPEGSYTGNFSVRYRNGYISRASSAVFILDVTKPRAVVQLTDPSAAFSPNNDGSKDDISFKQDGSPELLWTGEVLGGAGAVRTFRFTGAPPAGSAPPALVTWDGLDAQGALAPDGEYTYRLSATDQAGNYGFAEASRDGARVSFTLTTKDTPVLLSADLRAFSPNGDKVKDTISLRPQLQETTGVRDWTLTIRNEEKAAVRVFKGDGAPPQAVTWDGAAEGSKTALPDGVYRGAFDINYVAGNHSSAESRPFTLDTAPPEAEVSAPFTLFSPNGDGKRDELPINVDTRGNEEWTAVIKTASGEEKRAWTWAGAAPSNPLPWDGKDNAGNAVADGDYVFTLSAEDEAGNKTTKTISGIKADARVPKVFFTASTQAIAPEKGSVGFGVTVNPSDGISAWRLALAGPDGRVYKTWESGAAGPSGSVTPPPASINWNGEGDGGTVTEGTYTPTLTVSYAKGDEAKVSAPGIIVDGSGPVLGFVAEPEYFSPDNDGVDDDLIMSLKAADASPIASWNLEINERDGTKQLFYRIEGKGSPAERIVWDGRSNKGELVQAATDYSYVYRAVDALGNASVLEGTISVDVLVIRDGDKLRIQVPSIVFRANAADFEGLDQAVVDNNNRVLKRIALILNKFRDYKITVEGHANPVTMTQKEEETENKPLSEKRAKAVVEQLAGYGVNRARLTAIGVGGTRTVADPRDESNRWKNRRVEFILIK